MRISLKKLNKQQRKEFLKQYSILKDIAGNSFSNLDTIEASLFEFIKVKKIISYIMKGKDTTFLIGYKYWYKDRFKLKKGVFVPQYDTEGIIDLFDDTNERGIEIGPGIGVISATLSKYKNKQMISIDINKKAVELTAENAGKLGVLMNSLNKDAFTYKTKNKYDFLVSNPPYINKEDKVESWVSKNQPENALYADQDGLSFYKFIIKNYKNFIKQDGYMKFEIGYDQKNKLQDFLKKEGVEYNFSKDLSGNWRFLEVKFNGGKIS